MDKLRDDSLQKAADIFNKLTIKPEKYLSIQESEAEEAKLLGKLLYDFTKKEEDKSTSNALPNLIVEDFDEEQIWQEIELQNEDKWSNFISNVSSILSQKKNFNFPIEVKEDATEGEEEDDQLNGDVASGDEDGSEEEEYEPVVKEKSKTQDVKKKKGTKDKISKKKSIVDDQFFRLDEMEAFLDAQDKMEMKKTKPKSKSKSKVDDSSEEDDDDESIDMFAEIDDESDEENGKEAKYVDFFDDGSNDETNVRNGHAEQENDEEYDDEMLDGEENQDDSDSEIDLSKNKGTKDKKVRFSMPQSSSDDEDSSANENDEENMTEYEKRQQRLKSKISNIESNMLEEKAWPMKGEVSGTNRPQNSLLEEVVDFDISSRPAPIITEETTLKLQDIILRRIKDKAWDDVVRKIKPVKDVQEFKKDLVLDQEKSKLSLAQVYEQDYIKQREALDPDAEEKPEEVPKEHEEIKKLMTSLFAKLDALSNFHYTPSVSAPEVKIISNIPAIAMEEVAPVATSDAMLLAPEEVKAKPKGDIIGKSERTDTDKKRERRQKKIRQREREKERQKKEKLLDKMHPGLGNKYSREKASKLLDKVTKDRNVDKMETIGDGKSIKSSTAFFTQLQEEVTGSIKAKTKSYNKKNKNILSAKKLKL